jgi:hypothetical protein
MMMRSILDMSDEELTQANMTQEQFQKVLDEYEQGQAVVLQSAQPGYRFQLADSKHNTYATDYMLVAGKYPALLPASLVGTIEGNRAVEVIDTYVDAFFDKHLENFPIPLLDGASPDFPEVDFTVFNP